MTAIRLLTLATVAVFTIGSAYAQNTPPPGNVNPGSLRSGAEQTGAENQPRSSGGMKMKRAKKQKVKKTN